MDVIPINQMLQNWYQSISHSMILAGKFEEAVTFLKGGLMIYPHDLQILRSFAYANLLVGNHDRSIACARHCLTKLQEVPGSDPGDQRIWSLYLILSKAYWALGEKEKARAEYQHYLEGRAHLEQTPDAAEAE